MRLIFPVVEDPEALSIEGRPSIQLLIPQSRRGQRLRPLLIVGTLSVNRKAKTARLAPIGLYPHNLPSPKVKSLPGSPHAPLSFREELSRSICSAHTGGWD
jgi:hypothetical protein